MSWSASVCVAFSSRQKGWFEESLTRWNWMDQRGKKRRVHLGDFDCVVFFRCEAQIEQSDQLAAERHQSGLVRCDCIRLHATQRLCFLHDCGGVDAG